MSRWTIRRSSGLLMIFCLFILILQSPLALADEAKTYSLKLETPPISDGKGQVVIRITPTKGTKINKEFPLMLVIDPPPGVLFSKTKLSGEDATELESDKLVMSPAYILKAQKTAPVIPMSIRFGTCEVKDGKVASCFMHREKLSVKLPLLPAAPR